MRKFFAIIIFGLLTIGTKAQIPYFSGTVGDRRLYSYTSLKLRPGMNSQETYTTFQYGVGKYFAAGLDLYTQNGSSYTGYLIRVGHKFSDWYGIGVQLTPSFNLSDNFKFSYLTSALYMNGKISRNKKFFWCSNTWYMVNDNADDTIVNWEYLGYSFSLRNDHMITPMVGAIHSWKFDQDLDIAAGFYYTIRNWNIYLWGDNFLKNHPRVVIGIDFTMQI